MNEQILRRIIHMLLPLFLVYYWLPQYILGVSKSLELIILLIIIIAIESYRCYTGKKIPCMRSYEVKRIAAYAQAAIALCLSFLFFPMELVVPVVIGMSLIDPLIGILRKNKYRLYPILPAIIYFFIFIIFLFIISDLSNLQIIIFSMIGSVSGICAEYRNLKYIDDDFLMIIIPLLILTPLWILLF